MRRTILGLLNLLGLTLLCTTAGAAGYQFYPVTPCRIVDTRLPASDTGGPGLSSWTNRNFPISGYCGIPGTAQAVAVNIAMLGATQTGFLSIYPYGGSLITSTINVNAGEPGLANGAIVPLAHVQNSIYNVTVVYGTGPPGYSDLLIDVTGYFQ